MTKICLNCGKEFPKPHCSNKQWAKRKFCSPKCSKQGQKYWNRGHKTLICIKCNIRKPRRHNRICDHCWHLDRMKRWKNGELLHHPNPSVSKRNRALAIYGNRCQRCDYDSHPEILILHHVDYSHKNNKRENWQILCPNCHYLIHYESKTGMFSNLKS